MIAYLRRPLDRRRHGRIVGTMFGYPGPRHRWLFEDGFERVFTPLPKTLQRLRIPSRSDRRWRAKQRLAPPGRYYGDGGTIHADGELDVEVDANGQVVSVWFRCQLLPFRQVDVDDRRSDEMRGASHLPRLTGVEVVDR